ncbi:HAD family phosphatase [Streptomyces sp. NBC_00347]|uniref:HAD family hydrolase n=1 Tax=Streptomyces sp. NBC_00347 TaxID=2975721 RepID=UPI0022506D34|nr:HAD-IB family phosphatase [Streptomyces sp. NBC_00347]MCX5126204.1 HAD-IB family phosphatase [Streptomyces sp. NBC_00347]
MISHAHSHAHSRARSHDRIAVLDLDGTLAEGSLAAPFVESLIAGGVCDPAAGRAALDAIAGYHDEDADPEGSAAHAPTAAAFYGHFARALEGADRTEVERAAEAAWPAARKRFLPFADELVRLLHAAGLRTVLISGSPYEIVRRAAAELGIGEAHGMRAEFRRGRCTGTLTTTPALPGGKRAALRSATKGGPVDRRSSFAIGNSPSDAEVFEQVGLAVAFEPDPVLRGWAMDRDWITADRGDVLAVCQDLIATHPVLGAAGRAANRDAGLGVAGPR